MEMLRREEAAVDAVRLQFTLAAVGVGRVHAVAAGTLRGHGGIVRRVEEDRVRLTSCRGAPRQRRELSSPDAVGGAGSQWQGGVLAAAQGAQRGVHATRTPAGGGRGRVHVQALIFTL